MRCLAEDAPAPQAATAPLTPGYPTVKTRFIVNGRFPWAVTFVISFKLRVPREPQSPRPRRLGREVQCERDEHHGRLGFTRTGRTSKDQSSPRTSRCLQLSTSRAEPSRAKSRTFRGDGQRGASDSSRDRWANGPRLSGGLSVTAPVELANLATDEKRHLQRLLVVEARVDL